MKPSKRLTYVVSRLGDTLELRLTFFCLLESLLHTAHAGRKASRNTESLREISADLTFSYSFVCQTRRVSVTFVVIELSLSSIKQRKLERF